ncbi:MAG: ATP-binding protein [Pseudomonadota bacterium]
MKIARLLPMFAVAMLALVIAGVGLTMWTSNRAMHFNERVNLAKTSYIEHLNLKSRTYQLIKQYADAILIGDQDKGRTENELTRQILDHIANIRQTIGDEIALVGAEEIEELATLAEIEGMITRFISKLGSVASETEALSPGERWQKLSDILNKDIEQRFRSTITKALEGEQQEVIEAREEAAKQIKATIKIASSFALFAFFATAASFYYFTTNMIVPFRAVAQRVEEFGGGDFSKRIAVRGQNEIAHVARVLNDMASRVEERTQKLHDQKVALERAVEQRTLELERLLEQAEGAGKKRRQMLADVSHELRTPLTIIRGETDIALRGGDKTPAEYRDALTRAREAASHTSQLVDDLLFISRHEGDDAKLKLRELDLVRLLEETVAIFDPEIGVSHDLVQANVAVDPVRIRQAVLALLSNAQQYGGRVSDVVLCQTLDGYQIAISDDGPGMTEDDKSKAFERFFRGSNAAARYGHGSGLGLPIVRAIAEAHGGAADLHDRAEGGTTALIRLPRRPHLKAVS